MVTCPDVPRFTVTPSESSTLSVTAISLGNPLTTSPAALVAVTRLRHPTWLVAGYEALNDSLLEPPHSESITSQAQPPGDGNVYGIVWLQGEVAGIHRGNDMQLKR